MLEALSRRTLHPLLQIKTETYQLIIIFLLSLIIPGTLIMFYFYRNYFEAYDLTRLFLLIITISMPVVLTTLPLAICLALIKKDDENKNTDDGVVGLILSLLYSLSSFFVAFFVCFIFKLHSKGVFIGTYLILILALMLMSIRAYRRNKKSDNKDSKVPVISGGQVPENTTPDLDK